MKRDSGLDTAPRLRVASVNEKPVRTDGDYVLYWMIAARRTRWNFALQHAAAKSAELGKPLLVLEALRAGYPWASARLHRWVLDGMADNARRLARAKVTYFPYVEPEPDAGRGLLESLSAHACLVVTDEFPCFFLPRMVTAAAERLGVAMETVDSNGILPLRATSREYPTAYAFRRFLQKTLPDHLLDTPAEDPLADLGDGAAAKIPEDVRERWAKASPELLSGKDASLLARLSIDSSVPPVEARGGPRAGEAALQRFVGGDLGRYGEGHNHPDDDASSGLSPYLHFGHLSAAEAVHAVLRHEDWSPSALGEDRRGSRTGWWGTGESAESFLDELVTWRELGYVFCFHRPDDYHRWESLPDWARATMEEHAGDAREHVYSRDQFAESRTHDPLWNAAQRQLVREGRIHNYLRMLWGKKILEWSAHPRDALEVLIDLNNRYAVDGRNPNSYSGIFWVLGRFDRAWGPERPIFGKIRYMTSKNTARKVRLTEYLRRFGGADSPRGELAL